MGIILSKDQFTEVAEVSGVMLMGKRLISWTQELNLNVYNYFQFLKKLSHVMQLQLLDFSRETLLVTLSQIFTIILIMGVFA